MANLLRKPLLHSALLGVLVSISPAHAWDEAELPGALPQVREAEGKTIYNVATLKPLWEAQAVINTSRDKVVHISMDEEVVILQSSAGVVTAINAESGRRFWSAQVGRNDEVAMKATTDSQLVAIVVGPVIHAFDKFSGQKLFAHRLPNTASSGPLITRREVTIGSRVQVTRRIFIPMADKSVIAYDVELLEYKGRRGTLKPGVARAADWRFACGELVRYAPVAGQERLAFATDMGNIFALAMTGASKGQTQFEFLMNSNSTAPLTVVTRDDNESLLAACDNNRLFCIDLKTDGTMRWTIPTAYPVYEPICVVDNEVFVVSSDGELLKFSLATGAPIEVSDGASALVSQTEGLSGQLPAYGAAVEVYCQGLLEFNPIHIVNRSTGQTVNSVVLDLPKTGQLSFVADAENQPEVRVSDRSRRVTGMTNAVLSDDRRSLTINFTNFNPEEEFEFHVGLEHAEIPWSGLSHKELFGSDVRATVSPLRAQVAASAAPRAEPLPPRTIIGRFSDVSRPWRVSGVKSLVAITANAAYFVDINDQVVSVSRENADSPMATPTRDYQIRINNCLTDRVFLCTDSGRVACFTESRIQIGALPFPAAGGLTWLYYPQTALSPDFAVYHQNPGGRPLMPDVPKHDPPIPAEDGAAGAP